MEEYKIIVDKETKKEYKLEYTRASVVKAEADGFTLETLSEAMTKPMTILPQLFYYGLIEHQPDITKEESDDLLFNKLKGLPAKGIEWCCNAFASPYTSLIPDNEGDGKNATATVSW